VVALPPKAVEILVALVRHPGTVVGKPELIDTVWPESCVEEANLNQMIFLLRRAFGSERQDATSPQYQGADIALPPGCARSKFRAG